MVAFGEAMRLQNNGGTVNISQLINCDFVANSVTFVGAIQNLSVIPEIINCTFYGNFTTSGQSGGAIANLSANPTITNGIFWENREGSNTTTSGADIDNNSSSPIVTYSLTQQNSPHSTDVGIINNQNLLFTDPDGADNMLGTLESIRGQNTVTAK